MDRSINERALITKINKVLSDRDMKLKKCSRDDNLYDDLGDYYIFDLKQKAITEMNVDLYAIGKELGVIPADF